MSRADEWGPSLSMAGELEAARRVATGALRQIERMEDAIDGLRGVLAGLLAPAERSLAARSPAEAATAATELTAAVQRAREALGLGPAT